MAPVVKVDSSRGTFVSGISYTCKKYAPGITFNSFECWAPPGLRDGEAAVYFFMEWGDAEKGQKTLQPLMESGAIPPGITIHTLAGDRMPVRDGEIQRNQRCIEYDQPGRDFPSVIVEELIPYAEKVLGIKASSDPNLHFVTGASSGGIAAWNAAWYRNDYFRRCYCNSPTFSNMRDGNMLIRQARKCETRPIRVWLSAGTDEPDYYFGDSYFVAEDAVGAFRFAGYELRYDRFVHEGHGTHWGSDEYMAKVLTWLFEDWKNKPVTVNTNPVRVHDLIVKGTTWKPSTHKMSAPVREVVSVDGCNLFSVSPDNRFVISERIGADGNRTEPIRLAPFELAWDVSRPGGFAIVRLAKNDRLLVATELGVQSVEPFGIADAVLPLPDDLKCDNVELRGDILYASSGTLVFERPLDPDAPAPGYADEFWYSREHEPAGNVCELIGSAVMSARFAGIKSIVINTDGKTDEVVNDKSGRNSTVEFELIEKSVNIKGFSRNLYIKRNMRTDEAAIEQLKREWRYETDK